MKKPVIITLFTSLFVASGALGAYFFNVYNGKNTETIAESTETKNTITIEKEVSKEEIEKNLEKVVKIGEIGSELVNNHGWGDWAEANGEGEVDKEYMRKQFRTIMTESMLKSFVESNLIDYFMSPSPHAPEWFDTNMRLQIVENTPKQFSVRTVVSQTTAEEHGGAQYFVRMKKEDGIWKFDELNFEDINPVLTEDEATNFFNSTGRKVLKVYKTNTKELVDIRQDDSFMYGNNQTAYILELEKEVDGYEMKDGFKKEYDFYSKYFFFVPSSGYSYPMKESEIQEWKERNS